MKLKTILLVAFALVTLSATSSLAQGRFSVGPELALPMGDFGDVSGVGFGASVRYEGAINENLNWMGTVGFLTFSEKDDFGVKISQIPIQAGIKYYFTESYSGFYAGAELGFHIVKAKVDVFGESMSTSETEFGFAPQVGYHLANIDIALRYQIVSDADYVGVRLAYVFGGE
ncbi:MAG TPA: outer membrane beta-barrel protein [Ohtaekwangia sp.]|nr:outer membrane beta-barrel protein [Ohtaekwangia sp.]